MCHLVAFECGKLLEYRAGVPWVVEQIDRDAAELFFLLERPMFEKSAL